MKIALRDQTLAHRLQYVSGGSRELFTGPITQIRGPGERSRYRDSLRVGRSGDRVPVGARFSALIQTGPGAHPASCTMGTGSYLGEMRPGRDVDHPPPFSAEVMKE